MISTQNALRMLCLHIFFGLYNIILVADAKSWLISGRVRIYDNYASSDVCSLDSKPEAYPLAFIEIFRVEGYC